MNIDKDTKYDRQLRLWAKDGQARLENSHVCLINATTTGSETLKNLVLPGIGAFTIIDARCVREDDLSGNFFLDELDLGSSIAAAMARNLMELNSDVQGFGTNESLAGLLRQDLFWDRFSAVVVSEQIPSGELLALTQILWPKNIPLVLVSTAGFYGSLRIIHSETTIIETHDPSRLFDLRIDCPWPELQAYSDSFHLNELDDTDHAHVPYIIIFIKALQQWKKDHGGLPPQNYNEKKLFRANYVEKMSRNIALETNFSEASQSVHRALQVTAVPKSIKELLGKKKISDSQLSLSTPLFWVYIRALKNFVESNDGKLPLPGNLPDMASNTVNYIGLQKLYRDRALQDQNRFFQELLNIFHLIGRPETDISPESVASFCKSAAHLFVSWGSPLAYSEALRNEMLSSNGSSNETKKHSTLAIHFGILALHNWIEQGSPGGLDLFVKCFQSLFEFTTELPEAVKNTLEEIFVHHTSSYHNISSLMGGAAGQEILKISTAQYIPLDNLYVFDGIRSVSDKWKI